MNTTATRTATGVTVTFPTGDVRTFTGKRAATAVAISAGQWNDGTWVASLHGALTAARKNAATQAAPAYPGGDHWHHAQVIEITA